ncbi:hypothetical protein MNBD_GAMMA20-316 [hydrothermal vent metagenome]|uniref:Lipoprotein n=1 Tax=hydrothermal vent metagenome TaxID=652676 RepID=A0A3B1B2W6_9ZZZZ
MWTYLKLIIVVASIALQGCATYGKISALPGDGQKLIYKDDRTILISEKYNTVSLVPKLEKIRSGQKGDFILTIDNKSLNSIQFSINNISANGYSSDIDEMSVLKIFSREELTNKEKNSQEIKGAWSGLGSVLYGLDAAEKSGTTSSYSAESTLKKHNERAEKSKEMGKNKLQELKLLVSENTITILPGEKMSGVIRIQLPKITEVRKDVLFVVNVDKEEHKLIFTQKKIDKENN